MMVYRVFIFFIAISIYQNANAQLTENLKTSSKFEYNKTIYGCKIGYWKDFDSVDRTSKTRFYIYDTVLLKLDLLENGLRYISIDSLLKANNFCIEFCSYEKKLESVYNYDNKLDTIIVEVDVPIEMLDSSGKKLAEINDCFYRSRNPKIIEYYPNGGLFELLVFNNDLNQKAIFGYWENGKLKFEKHFNNLTPSGTWIYYNQDGSLREKKEY